MEYEQKIDFLLKKKKELEDKVADLEYDIHSFDEEIEDLKMKKSKNTLTELTAEEEKWLRDELTVAGNILCGKNVIFGELRLLHEDPDEMQTSGYFGPDHSTKYSINMDVRICTEFKASLNCSVLVKTKVPQIEAIVREMFKSSEDSYNPDPIRRVWSIDWDYYMTISLVKPYVHSKDT